ncbi:MAG: hypothetical protein H7A41_07270 [Chlamydiales bacterium]|nr:hypothetical protein [Chlamydiia bacterium]MCP5504935.1 hypothetical protein [Chlamydiales bacterium]
MTEGIKLDSQKPTTLSPETQTANNKPVDDRPIEEIVKAILPPPTLPANPIEERVMSTVLTSYGRSLEDIPGYSKETQTPLAEYLKMIVEDYPEIPYE